MTAEIRNTEQVIARGISMKPVHYRALAKLAIAHGHLSRSRVVQELIEDAMTKAVGPEWEREMEQEQVA